jgi:hypothetical protein
VTGIRPTALAYVSGPTEKILDEQRVVITEHAAAEGLAIERIVTDRFDRLTISELVAAARACDARLVLIPASTRMAEAQARVAYDLERHGAVCLVLGPARPVPQRAGRLANDPPRQRLVVPT